ncbi:MAG: GldG family protein [Thiotrichales bacterium]|nr:MAG: GldG family protein [Thiotrichales bacterium]
MIVNRSSRLQLHLQKMIFIILLLIAVGMLGWLSNEHSFQFDWTSNNRNTLAQNSIDLLNTLEHPVTVSVYVQDDETVHAAITEILQRYQREKGDFQFKLVNPDVDFESAQRDGVERYGQIIIKYNDNREIISSLSEHTITNALLRLSRSGNRKVVFLKGHGERDVSADDNTSFSKLAGELKTKGFTIESSNLLLSALPTDTAVLVLAAPDRELLAGELDHIITYVNDGGNLLWMMDPGDMKGTDELAKLLGIQFLPGIIVDNNTNLRNTLRIEHPAMVPVLDYVSHPVTEDIQYNTLFPISRGVEQIEQQFKGTVIAQSLAQSWSEVSALSNEIAYEPDNGDVEGPVGILMALERSITASAETDKATQRIIVAGDSDFLANSYIGAGANLSLGLNMFNWLVGDDDLIAIESKNAPDTQLELTDTEILLIGSGFFIVLPAGLVVAGVVIWLRRRNR